MVAPEGQLGFSMNRLLVIVPAVLLAALASATAASADQYLGSYQARISPRDHHASDGYALDTAAQMVRQDRANVHQFGYADPEDENDPWFGTKSARANLERMLGRGGAMSGATRNAIANGTPVIQVDVYRNSVHVEIVGY
jgi:hypothetical protein